MGIIANIEPVVFTKAYNALIASYPTIDMKSVPTFTGAKETAVRLYEMNSQTVRRASTLSDLGEKMADKFYEVQVRAKAKSSATPIYYNIHETLMDMGFQQTSWDSFFDDSSYRIVSRYRCRVDSNGKIT